MLFLVRLRIERNEIHRIAIFHRYILIPQYIGKENIAEACNTSIR